MLSVRRNVKRRIQRTPFWPSSCSMMRISRPDFASHTRIVPSSPAVTRTSSFGENRSELGAMAGPAALLRAACPRIGPRQPVAGAIATRRQPGVVAGERDKIKVLESKVEPVDNGAVSVFQTTTPPRMLFARGRRQPTASARKRNCAQDART